VCGTVQYIVTVTVYTGGIVISNDTINEMTYSATGLSDDTEYSVSITPTNNGANGNSTDVTAATTRGGKFIILK